MKQTIELNNFGLRELSLEEARDTDGGIPFLTAYLGAMGIAYYAGYGAHALYDYFTD